MMPRSIENKLIEEFAHREFFNRQELLEFYRAFEPELKEGTFGWRIYDLKTRNIIKPIKRGIYVISYKPKYKPNISEELLRVIESIPKSLGEIKYCLWDSDWLNEFAQHQASKRIIIIEVEKDYLESFYYQMRDSTKFEIFLEPSNKEVELYVSESKLPVVIKRLISRSPIAVRTSEKNKFHIPQLEKILVDLFAQDNIFYLYRGYELVHVFENAIANYTINFTRLLSYAKRRDKEKDLQQFLAKNMDHILGNMLDD